MTDLRFDGRTAIVTGAGGNPSMGRAHALLLASRGANVVVNDIGTVPEVTGYAGTASAEAVAEEIRALGGRAVADTHSVASIDGASALVQTALDAFGGADILINNAGVCIMALFDELTTSDFQRHVEVNLLGPAWTCRAAWPHMKAKGYGRIVNIGSGGMSGATYLSAYGASKGGLFSLTRALAAEGAPHGIKANTVHPNAFTRMLASQQKESSPLYITAKAQYPAELVSPVVGYLAHESCQLSGECIDATGGHISRVYLSQTAGFTDTDLTIESLAERLGEVIDHAESAVMSFAVVGPDQWDLKPYKPAGA
jgi:NAD(P)-dependent dehydrogenase (short-subunit alcohol dehydrogenase family)